MNSIPFDSISRDRVYKAEDWAWYFGTFIGNGVFPKPETGLQAVANENMTVTVKSGYAFIDGYAFRNPRDYNITLNTADGALARIDRIVVRWDLPKRDIYIDVLKGTPDATPKAKAITRNTEIYELVLADITVGKGVTGITTADITDRRFNSELCGIVTGTVEQIDASVLTAQFDAFFAEYKENILKEYAEYLKTLETDQAAATAALEGFKKELNSWEQTQKTEFAAWLANTKDQTAAELTEFTEELNSWEQIRKAEFDAWYANIKNQLNEEVAGNLQLEIEDLQKRANALDIETENNINEIEQLQTRVDTIEEIVVVNNSAQMHNSIFRGKDLTNIYSIEQLHTKVAAGDFTDLFIGDYITVTMSSSISAAQQVRLCIAAFDYFYAGLSTSLTTHHLVLVPMGTLYGNAYMNATDSTLNGYTGTDMCKNKLPAYTNGFNTALGGHLIYHNRMLSSTVVDSVNSAAGMGFTGATVGNSMHNNVGLCLMSETMVFGSLLYSSSPKDVEETEMILPLFALAPNMRQCNKALGNTRMNYWLSSVSSTGRFVIVNNTGSCSSLGASSTIGVRPYMLFG